MNLRLSLVACLLVTAPLAAQQPPSYTRQVRPFLAKYCIECHNPEKARGRLDLSTVKAMAHGGRNGPFLVPGNPETSVHSVRGS